MILLNHFENAAYELKAVLVSQLREQDILDSFLKSIYHLLDVEKNPFNLSGWDFSQYYHVEYYDIDSTQSKALLCAHLYWRALILIPSLVRIWFSECKNRQLSIAVEK